MIFPAFFTMARPRGSPRRTGSSSATLVRWHATRPSHWAIAIRRRVRECGSVGWTPKKIKKMGPFWMEQLDGNQWDFGILVWDFRWISNGHRWESMDRGMSCHFWGVRFFSQEFRKSGVWEWRKWSLRMINSVNLVNIYSFTISRNLWWVSLCAKKMLRTPEWLAMFRICVSRNFLGWAILTKFACNILQWLFTIVVNCYPLVI